MIADALNAQHQSAIICVTITTSAQTYFLADQSFVTSPTDTPPNQIFLPLIEKGGLPRLRRSIKNAFRKPAISTLTLTLLHYDIGLDLRFNSLADATVVISVAARGFDYSDAIPLATMVVQNVSGDGISNAITLSLRDAAAPKLASPTSRMRMFGNPKNGPVLDVDQTGDYFIVGSGPTHSNNWNIFSNYGSRARVYDNGAPLENVYNVVAKNFTGSDRWIELDSSAPNAATTPHPLLFTFYTMRNRKCNNAALSADNDVWLISDYDPALRRINLLSDATDNGVTQLRVDGFYYSQGGEFIALDNPAAGDVTFDFFGAINDAGAAGAMITLCDDAFGSQLVDVTLTSGGGNLCLTRNLSLGDVLTELANGACAWWHPTRAGGIIARDWSASPVVAQTFSRRDIIKYTYNAASQIMHTANVRYDRNWQIIANPVNSLSENQRRKLQQVGPYRTVTDSALKSANSNAIESPVFDSFGDLTIATNTANAWLALLSPRREITIDVPMRFPLIELGEAINIDDEPAIAGNWRVVEVIDYTTSGRLMQKLTAWEV